MQDIYKYSVTILPWSSTVLPPVIKLLAQIKFFKGDFKKQIYFTLGQMNHVNITLQHFYENMNSKILSFFKSLFKQPDSAWPQRMFSSPHSLLKSL